MIITFLFVFYAELHRICGGSSIYPLSIHIYINNAEINLKNIPIYLSEFASFLQRERERCLERRRRRHRCRCCLS